MADSRTPRGGGLTGWLPLLVGLMVTAHVTTVTAHGGNPNTDDRCVPWICSCFYYGVYYDKGDVWESQSDPCTKYQCVDNGVFLPIKAGCSFKGECRERNSTWTEGCFRYRCNVENDFSTYELEEAACVWKDGNCYKVGQKAVEHCDTFECQIDDGCYVMKKIKTGCLTHDVEKPCKPMLSFWQDECAVYQCTGERQDKLRARILTHSHDVMMWPRGHYALPEPVGGCPNYGENFWRESWYKQCGDGCNYKSQEFFLKGNYTALELDHHFCVHHDVDDPSIIPLYQTYWEAGRYCILRFNGTCPDGFEEGFVEMNNHECNATNVTVGVLPDGNYTCTTTRMEFCCRYDGEIERPIVLPAKHQFVLFMANNESECQQVRGMNHKIQFWSFCDVNDGVLREMNGSLPFIKTGDNNTLINSCFYSPIGCGCTDVDEEVVAVGERVTKKCVTKECRDVFNHNILVVVEGGCMDDVSLKCRLENESWTDMVGETCKMKLCVRKYDNKTQTAFFEIADMGLGCRDKDQCVPLNYTKVKGCYQSQCQEDKVTGLAGFEVIKAGCSDGHGHCIPQGQNVTQGCITLNCDRTRSACGLSVVKGGCSARGGKCFDVGANITQNCMHYSCKEYRTSKSIKWKLEVTQAGCIDSKRKCYNAGDRINASCCTYECIFGDRPGFYPVWAGCNTNLGCVPPNEKLKHGCSTYNCTQFENGTRKLFLESKGCTYKEKCYDVGSNITDAKQCITYTCTLGGKLSRSLECPWQKKCYPPNKEFKDGCNTYRCSVNATHRVIQHVQLACKVDDKCIDPGVVYKRNCNTYKCSEDKTSCNSYLIEVGCKDKDTGKCLEKGDIMRHGCSDFVCQPNGKNNPFKFKSGDCNYNNKCYKLGKPMSTDNCGTATCQYKKKDDPSSGLVISTSKGCEKDGKCIGQGEGSWDKTASPYYCYKSMCHYGKIYDRVGILCKTKDNECLTVKDGETKHYKMVYKGRTCSATCLLKGNQIKIRDIKC
ncbi:uncharacterized protein [Haliotis cracherodii]|uniref:uncharacterized protein n=1 Tax=Haliotis cracherodii TaxID=6455 RepID=UPI0039ECEEFD